jgi:hypothetical protein
MPIRRLNLRGLWLPLVLWIAAAYLAFGRAYLIAFNLTESLPGTLFLIRERYPAETAATWWPSAGRPTGPIRRAASSSNA